MGKWFGFFGKGDGKGRFGICLFSGVFDRGMWWGMWGIVLIV